MHTLRVLHIAPELAPLSGEGDEAEAAHALCRGLSALRPRIHVTAATFYDPGRAPEDFGLARRLEPIPVTPAEGKEAIQVSIHEGLMNNGLVQALVGDFGAADEPVEALTRLALEYARRRGEAPHLVHVSDRAPQAALVARAEPLPVVLSVGEPLAPLGEVLRAAVAAADRVVVASPGLARRVAAGESELAEAAGDPGKIRGLLPGIDESRFNPERDPRLSCPLSASDRAGKAVHKRELQRELGLPPRADTPLFGAVGPLDLLDRDALAALAELEAQLAILLDPERDVDAATSLAALAKQHATRIAVRELRRGEARERAVHRLLAAADFWLLPRLPPTRGHLDLHCLAYGAVPVAPRAGTFADVLVDFDPATATGSGFLFAPESPADLGPAAKRAVRAYSSEAFPVLVERAMRIELGWKAAASRMHDLYLEAVQRQKLERVVA